MKRLILLIILVMLAFWVLKMDQRARWAPTEPSGHRNESQYVDFHGANRHFAVKAPKAARQRRDEIRQALHEVGDDIRQGVAEVRNEVRLAVDEVCDEIHQAFDEGRVETVSDDDPPHALPAAPPAPAAPFEHADGLPVPIVPGSRVTEAHAQPPAPRGIQIRTHAQPDLKRPAYKPTNQRTTSTVDGLISSTKERAWGDACQKLREAVAAWLEPEVPRSWNPPVDLVNSLVMETRFEPIDRKTTGIMYVAHVRYDASPDRRAQFVKLYNREVVGRRLINLGGSLSFILICLAAVSGYIRADEATKGYYTNRLRLLAAAGVGAGGVILYQMFA